MNAFRSCPKTRLKTNLPYLCRINNARLGDIADAPLRIFLVKLANKSSKFEVLN